MNGDEKPTTRRRISNSDVSEKFDAILENQVKQQELLETLSRRVGRVEDKVQVVGENSEKNSALIQGLDKMIRGNGGAGIATKLEVVSTKLDSYISNEKEKRDLLDLDKPDKDDDKKDEEGKSTKVWAFDKLIVPFILAFAYWFLFEILPKLIQGLQ